MNQVDIFNHIFRIALIFMACLMTVMIANAQGADEHYERLDAIALWPDQVADPEADAATIKNVGVFQNVTTPTMIAYLPPKAIATGTSLLICPGGGYSGLAWLHHVERLAPLFTSKGIAVIGLKYRTNHADNKIPEDAVADFNQAIRLIRANADEWNLDPDKIVGLGFSAGSNLLLQYACTPEGEHIKYLNFLCLWPYFREADSYIIQKKDLDVILFTTEEDKIAPASFSVEMAEIFNQSGSRAQLVKRPKGNHLAFNFEPSGPTVDWTEDFFKWLDARGLLAQK